MMRIKKSFFLVFAPPPPPILRSHIINLNALVDKSVISYSLVFGKELPKPKEYILIKKP